MKKQPIKAQDKLVYSIKRGHTSRKRSKTFLSFPFLSLPFPSLAFLSHSQYITSAFSLPVHPLSVEPGGLARGGAQLAYSYIFFLNWGRGGTVLN